VANILSPAIMGEDPLRTDWLWEKMYSLCLAQARDGVTSSALALIDTALWDLKGKALGQPVYRLLGERRARGSACTPASYTFRTQIVAILIWVCCVAKPSRM